MIERLLSPRELSELVGVRENTLAAWRSRKAAHAPPYLTLGRAVRYRESDVRVWLARRQAAQPAGSK